MFSPCRRPDDATYDHKLMELTGAVLTFRWAWRIRSLDLRDFDVLHAHGDDHLVRKKRCPSIHIRTLHGSCFDEAMHIRGAKERLRMLLLGLTELISAVRTPVVVGVSRNSIRMYPWLRRVIPNGVDTELFRPGQPCAEPTVLFVGTYHGRKRGALLAQTFSNEVLPVITNARLRMVSTDAPPGERIDVLGRLSDEALAEAYREAWVFCLPSTFEGFGIPYAEAIASGLPIVSTPNRGAREVLAGYEGATIVDDASLGGTLVTRLRAGPTHYASTGIVSSWGSIAEQYELLALRPDKPHA
jgi:phosphatidyl-myo-inositol alpha-mannosyltransferase